MATADQGSPVTRRSLPSALTASLKAGGDLALFLDIDGTLLNLAPRPELVVVPPELPQRLVDLARALGGALALVSGRPLAGIDHLFPPALDAVGTHGAEWRLGGQRGEVPSAGGLSLAEVAATLREEARRLPGIWLEPKSRGFAIHYRQAPELAALTRRLGEEALASLGPDYRLQAGKEVVEILPAQASKGAAIRRFLTHPPYAGRTPVFAGDDLTDEGGFAVVNELGGVSIRVGPGDGTRARFRLATPADLRDWLGQLAGPSWFYSTSGGQT
jgi:trehalose 6-phosphate phosphatase